MNEEIKKNTLEGIIKCPHCTGQMPEWMKGAVRGGFLNERRGIFHQRWFCSKECYDDYKKNFVVEIYNDKPIYCVTIDGEKRYMPYFEASYYFTDIEGCRRRMDMKVAVINDNVFKFMWAQYF